MPKDDNITTQESPLGIPFPGDLLDYFAGQAMGAILGNDCNSLFSYDGPKPLAKDSYILAEAMIAEKRRREGE